MTETEAVPLELPDLDGFRRKVQSLAVLDAILSAEPEDRHHSCNAAWDKGQMMASMRDGSGDEWFALISAAGIAVCGLGHEAESFTPGKPKPWVFGALPSEWSKDFLQEPAFDTQNKTWCIWRRHTDSQWMRGKTPVGVEDGLAEHLELLVKGPEGFVVWAGDYYEDELDPELVAAVYRHEPITQELVRGLNPEADFEALQADLKEIGYPR